jgi:hypothetical protein
MIIPVRMMYRGCLSRRERSKNNTMSGNQTAEVRKARLSKIEIMYPPNIKTMPAVMEEGRSYFQYRMRKNINKPAR